MNKDLRKTDGLVDELVDLGVVRVLDQQLTDLAAGLAVLTFDDQGLDRAESAVDQASGRGVGRRSGRRCAAGSQFKSGSDLPILRTPRQL